ncbi:MAG: DUF2149 domain-containing protein [Coriobacteriia bacterium]|nr:DUF2149 domain-containing protein [Coriobacteriia bacterium]
MARTSRERTTSRERSLGAASFAGPAPAKGDLDPMSGMANLVDVMLVFACGLLLALVVNYGVDLTAMDAVTQTGEMEQVDSAEEITQSTDDGGKGYEELGRAYRDPKTGQLYIEVQE